MADPLRAALRVVRERLTDDGFRALAHAMLDAALDELRDQPRAPSRRSHAGATKSGRIRRVPLLPQARAALASPPGRRSAWVFPGAHGQRRRDDDARWSPDTRLIRRTDGTSYRAEINGYRLRAGVPSPPSCSRTSRAPPSSPGCAGTWRWRYSTARASTPRVSL